MTPSCAPSAPSPAPQGSYEGPRREPRANGVTAAGPVRAREISPKTRSLPTPALLCTPLALVLGLLLVWPSALLLIESVRDPSSGELTLAYYARILFDARIRSALLTSLGLSAAVAAGSTLLCLAPAWLLVRARFRGKRLLRAIYALPMSFSGVIVGFLMVMSVGRAGFVPRLTDRLLAEPRLSGLAYTFTGLCLAYLYFEIPRATLTLEAAIRKLDFRLVAAARTLGARRGVLLRSVLVPMLRPALISTWAVTFSVSLGSFGVVLILATRGLSVLPLEIFMAYLAFPSDRSTAAAMSVTLIVLSFVLAYGARVLLDDSPARSEPVRA